MITLPMTSERYQEILTALEDPQLRITLHPSPTTMGTGYVAEMIARVLTAKSTVNDLAEEVERAYTRVLVLHNDLNTELELRSEIVTSQLTQKDVANLDASGRRALVRERVDKSYVKDQTDLLLEDQKNNRRLNETPPGPYELWEDIKTVQDSEIELRSLLKILDRRREQLGKLDSGIRLQQKTIETELSIHRSASGQPGGNGQVREFNPVQGDASSEPDADPGTKTDDDQLRHLIKA